MLHHLRSAPGLFAVALAGSVALPGLAGGSTAESPPRPPLVVTHAALWTSGGVQPNREILIRDGRVTAVGESGRLARPAGARVLDAGGDTLLPGLIDAHVHFSMPGRVPAGTFKDSRERSDILGRQMLRAGVTSARVHLSDLKDGPSLKRDAESDAFAVPRLQVAGPGFIGGSPDLHQSIVWGVKNAADAADKVRSIKDAGADWVALHELHRFQAGEAEAIVAEARRLGLRVLAGGETIADIERAVALEVDSIEYLDYADRATVERYPDGLLGRMQARGNRLFLVPPMGCYHRLVEYRRGTLDLDDPLLTEFLPPEAASALIASLREDRAKGNTLGETVEAGFSTYPGKFRQLREAGLQLVVGSDCGSPATFQNDAIWWELESWRRLGVSPHAAVRAATELASALLRQPDIGHLGVGARADFVLYRGSIDDGPLAVQRVRAVAKGGILFVDDGRWTGG